ncbi:hypothetical protein SDRG_04678 [Saprolegnia diclina VS20]|uniref:Uncharacterized protein n=1 Tax=Saprolegnia diclina (strain VS20) TaxID=1156394 RepID=T0S687_SAPDV|nr:hypothetical protein SDRG_04678 [Saprolegnia diclina VS20]EQC38252.1 hypothetical protein SDRG_04678 [Saprolegnia diclina VS20]|eukprot:XP_008608579.1 hypothetical protein SDRG_04678 [Saprolegnia diclina VS20]
MSKRHRVGFSTLQTHKDFSTQQGSDLALVQALEATASYDVVLAACDATGHIVSVVVKNGHDIPATALSSLNGVHVAYCIRGPVTSTTALVFWPKQHRLRQLGIAKALAYVQEVVHGTASVTILGYPSTKDVVTALIEMVVHNSDVGRVRCRQASYVGGNGWCISFSKSWFERTNEPAPLGASILQLLLDVDDVELVSEYLSKSCENESHPKLYLLGPKLHACFVRTSYADAVHLPFVLLASLAGVSDDPICSPLPGSNALIQEAYIALHGSCNVATILTVPDGEAHNDNQATDAALQLLKSCLLLEASFGENACVPPRILSHVPGLTSFVYFPIMYVLQPAIAYAVQHNPHVKLGAFSVSAVAARMEGSFDQDMSPLAMAGSFLLRLLDDKCGWTLQRAINDMLEDTDGDCDSEAIICGICALSKFIEIPIEVVTDLARHVARATICLTLLPLTHSERTRQTQRFVIADALNFFHRAAPHHIGMLLAKLESQLGGDDDDPFYSVADVATVFLQLLETFQERWPGLDIGVCICIAQALHAALQGTKEPDPEILAALSRLTADHEVPTKRQRTA